MNSSVAPRPKRLWAIAILDIAVALISFGALLFALFSTRVPADVRPGAYAAAFLACVSLSLIVSCVLALLRHPYGRWLVLGSAVVFVGLVWTQSALLLIQVGDALPRAAANKLGATVVRSSIEIGLNLWVFLSAKTAEYFRSGP